MTEEEHVNNITECSILSIGLKISAYVSFLYLHALCDAIQW